jgi:hypothetical protein
MYRLGRGGIASSSSSSRSREVAVLEADASRSILRSRIFVDT